MSDMTHLDELEAEAIYIMREVVAECEKPVSYTHLDVYKRQGCDGLVMMDYFQGNRAPYADSKARGMFWGLSIGTTPAHLARAVYEGVAYGANHRCV